LVIECKSDVKGFDEGEELLLIMVVVVVGEAMDIFYI
jgi:hypothetical protein